MADDYRYDVYLSYSTRDRDIVLDLAQRLQGDGLQVWLDVWEISPGDHILMKIEDGLAQSRILVYCMSVNTARSAWAQLEADAVRYRDPLNLERRFIPLRLDGSDPCGSMASLRALSWLPADREQEYPALLNACRQHAPPTNNSAAAERNPSPYPAQPPGAQYDVRCNTSRHASATQMQLSEPGKPAMSPPGALHGLEWWKKRCKREFDFLGYFALKQCRRIWSFLMSPIGRRCR